jgi:hypothetical protein
MILLNYLNYLNRSCLHNYLKYRVYQKHIMYSINKLRKFRYVTLLSQTL